MTVTSDKFKGFPKGKTIRDIVKERRKSATKVFSFTLWDIAEIVGKSIYTIKRDIYHKKLNPKNLLDLAQYIVLKIKGKKK